MRIESYDYPMVSIRSPHRSEGRRFPIKVSRYILKFQSAPPTEVRGDRADKAVFMLTDYSFNPLPPPK